MESKTAMENLAPVAVAGTAVSPTAQLEKTKLALEGDALVKRQGGNVVGRHSLDAVVRVEIVKRTDMFAVLLTLIVLAGAVAMKFLVPNPTWSWTGFVVLALGALVLMTGIRTTVLTVATRHGDVGYNVVDPLDQAESFVVTVREELDRRAGPPV